MGKQIYISYKNFLADAINSQPRIILRYMLNSLNFNSFQIIISNGPIIQVFDEATMSISIMTDSDGNDLTIPSGEVRYPCMAAIDNSRIAYTGGYWGSDSTDKAFIIDLEKRLVQYVP